MTIKTLKAATSTSNSISLNSINKFSIDMPKSSGAVRRNLFGSVDRNNLNEQTQNSKRENERALSNYKPESIIGVLNRNDEDQARRLKCLPAAREEKRRQSCSSNRTLQSMMLRDHGASSSSSSSSTISSSSSSSATSLTSYKSTESAKLLSTQKAINQTLPKGQKTIKDYYPTIKKSRQNQR